MPRDLWMERAAAEGWLKAQGITTTREMIADLAEMLMTRWEHGFRCGLAEAKEATK